jgi:hypothetical protein
LHGFDERLFLYFEDTDLSLRARLAGWTCLAVPGATVWHDHTPGFSPAKLRYLERNRWWTLLKLLERRTLWALLPALVLAEILAWAMAMFSGPRHVQAKARACLDLLRWLPDLPAARARCAPARVRSDAQLIELHRTLLPLAQVRAGPPFALAERFVAGAFIGTRLFMQVVVRR